VDASRDVTLMRKIAVDLYLIILWMLCGTALYDLFRDWWPWQRPFWDSAWTGGLLIALLAALIVEPAGRALGALWGSTKTANPS
jgi:hypothetical protein